MANESVTITFETYDSDSDSSASLSIELDDERNEEANSDRTSSFLFGDEVFFRVYPTTFDSDITIENTDGDISSYGKKASMETETLTFTEPSSGDVSDNTESLSNLCYSEFTSTSIGSNECGAISLGSDNITVNAEKAGVGVFSVSYNVFYHLFSIKKDIMPSGWDVDEPYPIVVLALEETDD